MRVFSFTASMLLMAASISIAQEGEFHLDETYSISSKGTIKLSTDDANVVIVGTNRSDVRVKIDRVVETKGLGWGNQHFDVEIKEWNGDLDIQDFESSGTNITVGYYKEEYDILIEAPESVSLEIIGDDGDYEIKNFDGDIDLKIDDGDALIQECFGKYLKFNVDDGDILVRGARGSLELVIDDGDFELLNGDLKNIDIRADDADIDIETAVVNEGNYDLRLDDSSMSLLILDGGGRFDIRYDDGRVIYSDQFDALEEDDDYTLLKLPGGDSRVKITGDDYRLRLGSE